jgi:hypothetical protein
MWPLGVRRFDKPGHRFGIINHVSVFLARDNYAPPIS